MSVISRISFVRVFIVLAVVAGLSMAGVWWVRASVDELTKETTTVWVAPYVDATLTPLLHFEDPTVQPASNVVLGFVVANPSDGCAPSWGTYYDLDAAARALDLDRRIVRLRESGGNTIVSFGGAFNEELAVSCTDEAKLVEAYQSVIDRYDLNVVDFDIEGASLANIEANTRRADAIKKLQADNPGLKVWFTLPVAPSGLTTDGVAVVDTVLQAGVNLSGVNLMTMDYGGSREPGVSMEKATEMALTATWRQLDGSYRKAGMPLTEQEVWERIGATPMIGQNDTAADIFTTNDAEALVAFATRMHLGRISYWSANRDIECGIGADDGRVSNTCSGVKQEPLEFAQIFQSSAEYVAPSPEVGTATPEAAGMAVDDPRTSPYPVWRSSKEYVTGDKVVWQNRVYEAKWYSLDFRPDEPADHEWDTPWRYLGPVLESDRQAVQAETPVADSGRPKWSSETIYVAGDEVVYGNQAFRAKWWTQGDTPQADPDRPYDHPWEYLGRVVSKQVDDLAPGESYGPSVSSTPSDGASSRSLQPSPTMTPDSTATPTEQPSQSQ